MTVTLTALNPDTAHKDLDFNSQTAILIFDVSGAPFRNDVGETSAATALHYAAVLRTKLTNGEFEQEFAREKREEDLESARESLGEFAEFCEHSGGYTMWV
jgi:hypothetical protein